MTIYSWLLAVALVVAAPWWLARMMSSGRYRAGLRGRLGRVPEELKAAGVSAETTGSGLVWVHAVSVGEVMAAVRLVGELRAAGLVVAVSTTTETGQQLARKRFGEDVPVFYMPLDFKWTVRRYLEALRPRLVVLMESELWPRLMWECGRAGIPMAVVNARVSDRSFPRYMRLKKLWRPLLERVSLFLAQDEETAKRLRSIGVKAERVRVTGNLKYDVRVVGMNRVAEAIRELARGRPVIVAGSTVSDARGVEGVWEEELVIQAWALGPRQNFGALLVIAPRHPQRFLEAELRVREFLSARVSDSLSVADRKLSAIHEFEKTFPIYPPVVTDRIEIVLLDTIGDLAAVYGVADLAFVGGSLVRKGGHNPLEAAQFGVPVVIGESYENFKGIVGAMRDADAIRIVGREGLGEALVELMTDRDKASAMGERGRAVFEAQAGATGRTVAALMELMEAKG